MEKAVPGVRWERREQQMEVNRFQILMTNLINPGFQVILYGVDDTTAALAIRDAVETFVIRARS